MLLQSSLLMAGAVTAATTGMSAGPCDIYASGGTPCVAAHSTTRLLYSRYYGPLYQVVRGSDQARTDIWPLRSSGVAYSKAQDDFCRATTCLISVIYDQSGRGNHLTQGPRGTFPGPGVDGVDDLASAIAAPVTLNGHKAYGVFVAPGTGYRNNQAQGTAKADEPEGMYAVFDGTHFNQGCCFDYGNAEITSTDPGPGHMEALYFGNAAFNYTGPRVMSDLEDGLFSGSTRELNPDNPAITSRFVTAILKGEANHWAIRGADSSAQTLSTYYDGARPAGGYDPMQKEGAIILGIGGDNSNAAQGTFYEGVMTSGYPSDDVENAVQANIAAFGNYDIAPLTSGPDLHVDSPVSMRATTAGCTGTYITHAGADVTIQPVTAESPSALKDQATWMVRSGLANDGCFSFESKDTPGSFLRHSGFKIVLNANDNTKLFREDATFCNLEGLNGQGSSIRSWSFPNRYFRHFGGVVYIGSNGGVREWDNARLFNDDVSWVVGPAL